MGENVTNLLLIDKIKDIGLYETSKWLHSIANERYASSSESSNYSSVKKSYDTLCKRTFDKYKTLTKSVHQKGFQARLDSFLSTDISFPKQKTTTPVPKKSENVITLQKQVECLTTVASDVVQELNKSREENEKLENKIQQTEHISQAKVDRISHINQLRKKLKTHIHSEKSLNKYVKTLQNRIKSKNAELKRLRLKNTYVESCVTKTRSKLEIEIKKNVMLQNELERKEYELNDNIIKREEVEKQLRESEQENDYLRAVINDNVNTYDEESRKFTPELQQCVYDLLNLNIY